jgi:Family of unknown function (DUF6090)
MILARLSRAIRQQNWFAVVLEFVIVIAGVVIGFQVTEWAKASSEAERRTVVLDRLHDEIEESVSRLQGMVSIYDDLNTNRTEAIERLIVNDFSGMDNDAMTLAVIGTSLFPSFEPPSGVYDEIVSSGMLSTLGDTDLRDAIGRYQAQVRFLRGQITYFRDDSINGQSARDFDFYTIEYDPDSYRQRRHVIDWPSAAADPEFLEVLLSENNSMRAMSSWWEDTLESANSLCAETARLTGRSCTPPDNIFQ